MKEPANQDILNEGISFIVPTFNGSQWLQETIRHIMEAISFAKVSKFEILVVNDGSTDDTVEVVQKIAASNNAVRLVSQKNGGRFIARRTGTTNARYPYLLFVDTRVFIGKKSLDYVIKKHHKDPTRNVWCSHVRVETKGNIYAKFWEAIAFIAWRKYFKKPRDISYGIYKFDDYPKGTTCFFIKKSILKEANSWFEKNTKDIKTSNDDTLLIRHIANDNSINVSPGFWCLYHARNKFVPYIKHVFHRGKVFVDGFLRNDGNRFFIPLILFLMISILLPILILFYPSLLSIIIPTIFVLWALELLIILIIGMPIKDGLSLFILTPIFTIVYGLGIWRSVINIYVLKSPQRTRG